MTDTIATLELHSLKEQLIIKKLIQERMNYLQSVSNTREDTIEYLTLVQIAVRLPHVQEEMQA